MHVAFSAFKRHYRKASKVAKAMAKTGSFGFESHYARSEGATAKVNTPDAELTVRFVVLMRRFLVRADPLYFETMWHGIEEEYGSGLPDEARAAYHESVAELRGRGGIKIVLNGEEKTPENIYEVLAEGEYFGRDERARALLAGIEGIPFAGPMFWFQFYEYTLGGLVVASVIFNVIRHIERSDAYRANHGDADVTTHRCIFCLTTSGDFKSEEHVIPEALGSTDLLLPRGYVCDKCNNEVLSSLDATLAQSPLFAFQRVHFLPYDKQGRLPEVRLGSTVMKRTGPLNILVRTEPGTDAIKTEERADGTARFSLHETIPRGLDERRLARALCKVAFEFVALRRGRDYVCGSRFDAVRAFITSGRDFNNNLLMATECTLEPVIAYKYHKDSEGTMLEIQIYGVRFFLNLEERPVIEPSADGRAAGVVSFPLHGDGAWEDFALRLVPNPAALEHVPAQHRPAPAVPTSDPGLGTAEVIEPDPSGDGAPVGHPTRD